MRRCLPALTAVIVLAVPAAAQAAEGDIIVQRAPGLGNSERAELRKDAGVKLVDTLSLDHTELVEPSRGRSLAQALAALRADRHVVHVELDQTVRLLTMSSSFSWTSFWSLNQQSDADIDAPEAWEKSEGSGITVAVADTGVNAAHVDLKDHIDPRGYDFFSDDQVPEDDDGHGTHVAGTIAADAANETGAVGVAPLAKIMSLRVIGKDETGAIKGSMSDVADAFDYAGDLGVRIVNASVGGATYSKVLEDAIAKHPNTLYVAAAGNNGANAGGTFPCALPEANIVCVGASDKDDRRAYFSNFGSSVDLFAPGVEILSASNSWSSAYETMSGTSMAAPHVAGAAAAALAARPDASTSFLRYSVLSSVEVKPALAGLAVTGGRLNENYTVDAIHGSDPTSSPPPPAPTPVPPAPTATPVPPVVVPVAPAITALKVRGSLRTKKSKLKVSSTLTAATTVKFTVKRRGSKATFAGWSRSGRAGANSVTLTRKLPNKRTLKRGTYTLMASAGTTAKSATIRVP